MIIKKLTMDQLQRPTVEEAQQLPKLPYVLVLDNVRSLLNVGSIFRSADAFACDHLYLAGITGTPPHRELLKTSLGSELTVPWSHHAAALEVVLELKAKGYTCLALEQAAGSTKLHEWQPEGSSGPWAIVLGNEVEGVSQAVVNACDGCLEIPQLGHKHSLNVAVAAGVVMWQIVSVLQPERQRQMPSL